MFGLGGVGSRLLAEQSDCIDHGFALLSLPDNTIQRGATCIIVPVRDHQQDPFFLSRCAFAVIQRYLDCITYRGSTSCIDAVQALLHLLYDVPFTNDIQKMEQGLDRIDARGGTAMRDAIKIALDYSKGAATKEKRVLLVITDGNDNASRSSLDRIVRQAQQSESVIYAIGLFSQETRADAAQAKHALKELTSATGGLVFYPKDIGEGQQWAVEIAHDSRSQYLITY